MMNASPELAKGRVGAKRVRQASRALVADLAPAAVMLSMAGSQTSVRTQTKRVSANRGGPQDKSSEHAAGKNRGRVRAESKKRERKRTNNKRGTVGRATHASARWQQTKLARRSDSEFILFRRRAPHGCMCIHASDYKEEFPPCTCQFTSFLLFTTCVG